MNFLIFFLILGGFLLLPLKALAFGPGVHLELSLKLLEKGFFLEGATGLAFLYGSIVPDFFVSSSTLKALFHREEAFERLLKGASSPFQMAFALGYRAHLEADRFAHQDLIPAFGRRLDLPVRAIHYYLEWTLERNRLPYWYFLRGLLLWPGHRKLDRFLLDSFELEPRKFLTRKWVSLTSYYLFKIRRRLPPTNLALLFERRFQSIYPKCLDQMRASILSSGVKGCES